MEWYVGTRLGGKLTDNPPFPVFLVFRIQSSQCALPLPQLFLRSFISFTPLYIFTFFFFKIKFSQTIMTLNSKKKQQWNLRISKLVAVGTSLSIFISLSFSFLFFFIYDCILNSKFLQQLECIAWRVRHDTYKCDYNQLIYFF